MQPRAYRTGQWPAMGDATRPKIASARELELLRLVVTERSGREVAQAYEAANGEAIPYGTVYTLLAQMEARGWVKIRRAAGDRRVRRIKITRGPGGAALRAASRHYTWLAELAADALSAIGRPA